MGGSGGGGSSGQMSWPSYMHDMHHQWLNNFVDKPDDRPFDPDEFQNVATKMSDAMAANPFTGAVSYSPDIDIENAQDAVDDWNADINSGFTSFIANTMSAIDAVISVPTQYSGQENIAKTRIRRTANSELSRFNARMLDIGAIQNSTYMMALVHQEQGTRDRIYEFITGQEDGIRQARFQLLAQLGIPRLDSFRALANQQAQVSQFAIVAKSDEQQVNQQWENAEATWDLDLFQYGSNVLAGISGAVGGAKSQSQTTTQKALSSVMMGAGQALALGSAGLGGAGSLAIAGGPWGIAAGALVAGLSFAFS